MLRPTKVRQYLAMMRSRGFEARAVLAGSRIREAQLSDPSTFLDLAQCERVISNIVELTGNPYIGFEFGRDCQFTDLGVVGYAMASSGTLRQAVTLFFEYANSPVGLPARFSIFENRDGSWGGVATPTDASELLFRFQVEEMIGMGMSLGPILTGEAFVLREVCFASPRQPEHDSVRHHFPCPVVFEAQRYRTTFLYPAIDTPLRGNDHWVNDVCLLHCDQLLRRAGAGGGTITSLVRSVLLQSRRALKPEEVASRLHLSTRTLRRRLQEEGTTYLAVLDEFRGDLAREYLGARVLPVKEIASRLGFSGPDAFRRAFKAWNGQTLRTYRGGLRRPRSAAPGAPAG